MPILSKKNILHTLLVATMLKVSSCTFSNKSHSFDQNQNNHQLQLINIILKRYFKLRCTHYGKSEKLKGSGVNSQN